MLRKFSNRKFVSRNSLLAISAAAAVWSAQKSQAANLYWDPTVSTDSTLGGGTGSWDLSNPFWFNGTTDIAWTDTTGTADTAIFGGAAGAVTLNANLGAVDLVFTSAGYTLGGSDTLTLGADPVTGVSIDTSALTGGTTSISTAITLGTAAQTWTVGGGSVLSLSSAVTGTASITKSGVGALAISGNEGSYTGHLSIGQGELNINSATALGTSLFTINSENNGQATPVNFGTTLLDNTSNAPVAITTAVPISWNGAFAFVGSNSLNLGSGAFTMGGAAASTRTLTVRGSTLEIDGAVTDAGALDNFVKQGSGTLIMPNAGSGWGGTTTINGGTVVLGTTGTLGTATTALNLGNGGLSISGTQAVTLPAITDNAGADTLTLTPGAGALTVTAASLGTRAAGANELYRGTNLGSTPGAGVATILFSTPPALTATSTGPWGSFAATGTGTLGTTQAAVLKGALVDTSATGTGVGFATYDPTNGVRLLNPSTEQVSGSTSATYSGSGTGDNVSIINPTSPLALTGKETNTLQITNTSTSPLTVNLSGTLNANNGLLLSGSSPITISGGTGIEAADSSTTAQDMDILSTNTGGVTISSVINEQGATSNVGVVTFGGPGNFTITGALTTKSNGGVYYDGTGTLTLASATNMSSAGLVVNSGTVKLATGFTFATSRLWRVASGATIDLNGISPSTSTVDFVNDINGSGGIVTNSSSTPATLTLSNNSTTTGTQTFTGQFTGNLSLVQTPTSSSTTLVYVLGGQSTYTGSTTLNSTTMRMGINNALPITTALSVNGSTLTLAPQATVFDLGGFNQTVGSLSGTVAAPGADAIPVILNSIGNTNSTLTVNSSANTTYAGVIEDNSTGTGGTTGGTVALSKQGSGTLTLSGLNLYSGGTTIGGGTLVAASANSTGTGPVTVASSGILAGIGTIGGNVTVNPNGHLSPGVAGIGTLTISGSSGLNLYGGSLLDFDFNNTSSDEIIVGGALSLLNASVPDPIKLNVYSAGTTGKFTPSGNGTEIFNLIQYGGAALTSGQLSDLSVTNPVGGDGYAFATSATGGTNTLTLTITFPPSETWTDNSSDQSWANALDWSPNNIPNAAGASVAFPALSGHPTTVNLNGAKTVGAITFSGGSYTIAQNTSGTLTLDNSGSNSSITSTGGTANTISAAISLAGTSALDAVVSTASSADAVTLSGAISGGGGIIANGSGILALTGSNNFGGGVTIGGGTVQINSNTSLGAATATINTGTLEVLTSGIVESRSFQLGSTTSTIQLDGSTPTYEIDGNILDTSGSLPGTLNVTSPGGSGTLILAGTVTNSGGINMSASSTLQLGNTAGTLGATLNGGTVTSNSAINVGNSSANPLASTTTVTITSSLAGTGALTQNGGNLAVGGSNVNFSGPVSINNGKLILASGTSTTATGIGNIAITNSTLTETASGTIGNNATTATAATGAQILTFGGTVVIDTGGANNMTLANQLATAATTTVVNRSAGTGTLNIGVTGNTAIGNTTSPVGFANTFTGTFNNTSGSVDFLSRGGGSNAGQWNFTAPSGSISIANIAGSINFGSLSGSQPFGSAGARVVVGNLNLNTTYSGVIGANGGTALGLALLGTGSLTVSGANVYSGQALTAAPGVPTAVESGTLIAAIGDSADGTTGPFGPNPISGTTLNYALIGNTGALANSTLETSTTGAGPFTIANAVIVSGGAATATTSAYVLSLAGASAITTNYSGGMILENNATVSQSAGGILNETGGITGTDAFTGQDSTAMIDHGLTGSDTGSAASNSGYQTITFSGPGAINVSGTTANPANANNLDPNGYGIYDSNDPLDANPNGYGGHYGGASGFITVKVLGPGTTTMLSNNGYSGPTEMAGGVLAVSNLASETSNGGVASGVGFSPNTPASLFLTGGTLQYLGPTVSTDRLFSISPNGGGLDASGAGKITYSNTGANLSVDGQSQIGNLGTTTTAVLSDVASLVPGMSISDTDGALSGTTIISVNPANNTVVLSAAPSSPEVGDTFTFGTSATLLNTNRALTLTGSNVGEIDGTLSDSPTGTLGVSKTGGGTWILTNADTYSGNTNISQGTLTISTTATIANSAVNVSGTGILSLPAASSGIFRRNLHGLNITGGAADVLAAGTHANRTVLVTPALTVSGGKLDLANNDMVVQGAGSSGQTTLTADIATGYNNGHWNGATGILSSSAAATNNTALGIEQNMAVGGSTFYSVFDGVNVTTADVLVKYTYFGDANLDGVVNGNDYTLIDNGFNNKLTGWHNGDFNYDGVVNGDDYTLIDNAFNTQGASLAAVPAEMIATNTSLIAGGGSSATAVPEPATLGMLCIGAVGLLSRRRRK